MKKIIFSLILSTLSLMILSQTYNVTISGIVTDIDTGDPVLGQEMTILTDSMYGGGMYYNIVFTDSSGYYEDVMQVSDGEQGVVHVTTPACGIIMTQSGFFSPNMSQLIFNFQVCIDPGGGYCQAMFSYFPGDDSLSIQFMDQSLGGPDSWYWEFGDGTHSNLQNPIHLYSHEGIYDVCLSIFNSTDSCESIFCEDVFVFNDTTHRCSTWFEYLISDLTVDFQAYFHGGVHYIEYTWAFGDGTSGTGANITHTYAEDGIYNVLLTATDSAGCFADYMEMIWVGDNFTFEVDGYIHLDDSIMADFADVHLMTFDTIGYGLINVETSQINADGYYIFDGVGFENCVYFVQAELTDQSVYFGDYVPTYHLNAINWQEAWFILPYPTGWTSDVYMVSTTSSNSGNGSIIGTVTKEGSRELLNNVEILLLDQKESPVFYSRTNEEGSFYFSQLAYGTYIVYTEIVGIETIPFEVTLSEQNSSSSVNIVVTNGQAILGIDDINSAYIESIDNIFPNPVTDKSAFNIGIKEPTNIKIEILNQYGQTLYSNVVLLSTGKHKVDLPTLSLSQGYYVVRITADDNISLARKLIKLR